MYDKASSNICGWLDYIVTELAPFSIVDAKLYPVFHKLFVKPTTLTPISRNTLMKYMKAVRDSVVKKLSNLLKNQMIAIYMDGWNDGKIARSDHYVAIIFRFINSGKIYEFIAGISTLPDTSNATAQNHANYINQLLIDYNITINNVACLVCDNAQSLFLQY